MSDQARARKLADRIKEIAASTLERQVKDPRLGFVTVTDVRISGDLHDATVFYTVMGDEAEQADTAKALASATGLVRAEVGKGTGVRFTPTITFVSDMVPQTSKAIEDLIERARAADAELQRVRAGAAPAGDPDPYRKPAVVLSEVTEEPGGGDRLDGRERLDGTGRLVGTERLDGTGGDTALEAAP